MSKLDRIDPQLLQGNPRATRRSWEFYEPVVLAAFDRHPNPYVYRPLNRTPGTAAAAIRDAIRGKLAFHYPSSVDPALLASWYDSIVVKAVGEYVYIGTPEEVKETLKGIVASGKELYYPTLELHELLAFLTLLSSQRLTGPLVVRHPPNITTLPPYPNLEILTKPDGSLFVL